MLSTIWTMLKTDGVSARDRARRFFSDETGGEKDNINTLLILALIVLPLVALIITFGRRAKNNAESTFNDVMGQTID